MEKEYINPNNPVYFSYAWATDEHPDIEDDVNNLCNVLEENDIYYKRDKINLCNYRWCINDSEIEIGEGAAIIVVISERYLKSLHCMNEWHLIRENGKIWERVFPIVLEDANITNKGTYKEFYKYLDAKKKELVEQQEEDMIPLTRVETEAVNAGCYIADFKRMYQYLADNNRSNLHELRKDKYEIVISQLRDFLKQIIDNTDNNNTKPETTNSIPSFPVSIPKGLLNRDAEVEELYDGIIKNSFFNLVGVGGSGKTSLTYLMMQKHRYDFNQIAYVVVNNHIKDEFVEQINVTLNLPYEASENVMYHKITAFLEENYKSAKPNLLVLDINETSDEAENKKFIEELHEIINNWDILILSREHFMECKTKDLNQKQDKEFVKELFLAKAGDKYNSFEDFDGLFRFIDYTPILAEQLGIYLKPLPKKSLAEIKKVFHGENFRDEEIEVGVSAQNRQNTIVSFLKKLIDYNKFKPNAQKLLRHFVLWQAEYIEYNVIKNLLKGVFVSDDEYENALVELCKRAILTQKDLPDGKTLYKLHGLLAKSLRGQFDIFKQDYSAYLSNIKEIVEYSYYDFIPYADCIGNSLCEYDITDDSDLLHNVGVKFHDSWKTDYAKKIYEKHNAIVLNKVENHPNDSYSMNGLAIGYARLADLQFYLLNDYKSAKEYFNKAIIVFKQLPQNEPDYQNNLAMTYKNYANLQSDSLNDYISAKEYFNKAIIIGKKLPQNNPDYQNNLADIYFDFALYFETRIYNYELAKQNYKKAIEIRKQLPRDNSKYQADLAAAYNNLALLQEEHFQYYESSKDYYQKAIDIMEYLPKDNHHYQAELARVYNNFAYLYNKDYFKDFETAKMHCNKAINIAQQLSISNPLKYLINLLGYQSSLAEICFDNNEIKTAKSILEEIKPSAGECLAKNPNDEWTKTVNDSINELLEKINNSESAT